MNPLKRLLHDPIDATIKGTKELKIDDKAKTAQTTTATSAKDDTNTMNEYHGIFLENEFSKVVRPYLDKFETMKKNNLENIKFFAGNFMIHIAYKSLKNDSLEGLVKICDEMLRTDSDTSGLKIMYYALENLENNVTREKVHIYYRSIFQQFCYYFNYNSKSFDIFCTKNMNNQKICEFEETFDMKVFSEFIVNRFMNKSVIIDSCCKTKEDFQFLLRLYQCVIVYLKKIKNSITLLIKSDVNSKEMKIMNLYKFIYNNLDSLYEGDLEIYLSEIKNCNGIYKTQVKKIVYDSESICMRFQLLKEFLIEDRGDFFHTLWPYSINLDMSIAYNEHDINQYKNLDTKLFDCKDDDDICNLSITLSNIFNSWEYTFVRKIDVEGDNTLIIRYIGLYRYLRWEKNITWVCVEYNYVKKDQTYLCDKLDKNNVINDFFKSLESLLMQNSNCQFVYPRENKYLYDEVDFKTDFYASFSSLKSKVSIYERLNSMFNQLKEKNWSIEIIDRRDINLRYSENRPHFLFYEPALNVVDRFRTSGIWKEWKTDPTNNFRKYFLKMLYARFTYKKPDHHIQFYLKIDTEMVFRHEDMNDAPYNNALNAKFKAFVNLSKKSCLYLNGFPFDFDKFTNKCFSGLYGYAHQSLLQIPDLRKNFFKIKLAKYIIDNYWPLDKNVANELKICRLKNVKPCFYLKEDCKIYDIIDNEIIEKTLACSKSYFDDVIAYFSITKDEEKVLNSIVSKFCEFYQHLEDLLPNAENIYCDYFNFFLQFPTYFPENLWEELMEILKKSFGEIELKTSDFYNFYEVEFGQKTNYRRGFYFDNN